MLKSLFYRQYCMKYFIKAQQIFRKIGYVRHTNDYEHVHYLLVNHPNYYRTTVNIQKLINQNSSEDNSTINSEVDGTLPCKVNVGSCSEGNPSISLQLIKYFENCARFGRKVSFSNVKTLTSRFHELSDNELLEILLTLIGVTSLHTTINFPKDDFIVFRQLARECIERIKQWNKNQLLLVADICYALGGPFCTIFHPRVVRVLHAKPKSLNPYQLTQSFFYVNIIRCYNFNNQQPGIEQQILESLEFIGIEELSIIAQGFFKTQNKIKNVDLLGKITELVIHHKQNISDFTLNSLLKILQLSFDGGHQAHPKLCLALLKEMKAEIKNKNSFILVRLATIGNHLNLYENELINEIVEQLVLNFTDVRLKELDRICFVIMNSRVRLKNSQHFIYLIEKELRSPERAKEIKNYFYSFVACIYYLACMGYQSSLISEALKPHSLQETQDEKRNHINTSRDRQIYELDIMLQIEGRPEHQEFRLSNDFSSSLKKRFSSQLPMKTGALTSQENYFNELHDAFLKMMRKSFLKVVFIFPTLTLPEILFCTDGERNLMPFPHKQFDSAEDIKYTFRSDEIFIWHAVVLVGRSSFIHNTNLLRGSVFAQIRLSEKLGYNVILVHNRLLRLNEEEKTNEILKCLDRVVNKKWLEKLRNNLYSLK